MPNPFAIEEIDRGAAANEPSNPYSSAAIEADGRTALRGSLLSGQSQNPDQVAEAVKLSRTTGAPYEAIQPNLQEVAQGQRLDDYERMIQGHKTTQRFLTTPQNAAMANDDVGTLTAIERGIRDFIGGGKRIAQPAQPAVMTGREFSEAVRLAKQNNPALDDTTARQLVMQGTQIENVRPLMGEVRGPMASAETVLRGLAGSAARAPEVFSQGLSYIAADILGLDTARARNRLASLETQNIAQTPQFETSTGKGLYGGAVSTIQNAPGIALSVATGSPIPGLALAGAQSSVPAYAKYRERGASGAMAGLGAVGEGAVEVATEMLPMGSLLKVFGKEGKGAAMQFLKSQFQEQWTEQIATAAQDAIDTAIANPDKTWAQYAAERPEAAYQTFLATLVQSGAVTVAHKAVQKASGAAYVASGGAARAEQAAANAENLTKLAEASKLRQRDPESFAQFVNDVAEDSDTPTELFIDAETLTNTLNQSGITMEHLQMVAPVVAAQLRAASFVPGADIRVPVAEFAAAGANITTPLIDHLRESPQAMSRAEAKAYLETEGERLQGDVERELGRATDGQAYQQSVQAVATQFEDQLNKAGKFRPEVNKAYANLLGNFYASQAARAGMTPQEFMQKYQLEVAAKDVAGQQTLSQSGQGLSDVIQQWKASGISGDAVEKSGTIELKSIEVPFAARNQGQGTTAMQALADYADATGQRITLGASSQLGGDKQRLVPFYERFGFVKKARTAPATSPRKDTQMIREPKSSLAQSGIAQAATETVAQTDTPAFKKWFGDSKVVDADGKPLVVYHGTSSEFYSFNPKKQIDGRFGKGFYFSANEDTAKAYAEEAVRKHGGDARVIPVYLKIESPAAKGKAGGSDGIKYGDVYVAFSPEQIKSATGNDGTFDANDPNILNQDARATLNFANDITKASSVIALLDGADLSSFLHESGHFFLEVQADLAMRIQSRISAGETVTPAEQGIVDDMDALLKWFGVIDTAEASALDQWAMKSLNERREAHETFARGFERYAMEGRAPTQELQSIFSKFRSWLLAIYKQLKNLNVDLTDEVRSVMDRMLASNEAIQQAEDARNMGPLFQSPDQAGMTPEEFGRYQALGDKATTLATAQLDARLMKDMKWLSRAKAKALKALQAEADELRKETEREVRAEVMSEPVYLAWTFLTSKAFDKVSGAKPVGNAKGLNPESDNLFMAIAKLGGLNRAEVLKLWGIDEKEKLESGVFGMPVVRKTGGLSADAMAERLMEAGYLLPDEHGKADAAKFEELFDDQRRGTDRYSIQRDMAAAYGDAPLNVPEMPAVGFGKLRTEELRRRYGVGQDAVWRKLSERRMTSDDGGLDPDVVAEMIVNADGSAAFSSGDELVKKLAEALPPSQVIEEQVDQRMLERHGDITSAEALDRAADEAVHNELRARVIATELKAVQESGSVREGKRSTVDVLARAAREFAQGIIDRQLVRNLRPSQYAAAAARSARLAQQALGKSTEEVALHKRNELINTYATKASYDAQDEVKAAQAYFRKFDKRRKSIDAGYQDQIEQLLEDYDFKPASLKAIDKRKSFAAWYAEQEAAGTAPNVPDNLLNEANRKSYKDMTVEEVRGLRDTIKQIEHLGRLKNKLLLARDKRDFDAIAKEMAESIAEHGGPVRAVQLEGPNPVVDLFAGVGASHRKLASLFRQMDGGQDNGPMYQHIGRAMNERGTMEDVANEKATEALTKIYAPMLKLPGGVTGYRSKVFIPEINNSLTRGGRLSVALNWGNEANRQRIMDGDKWTQGQVEAILKTLSPQELQFVNQVWDYIDSFWPEIAAKEKRLTGVEPEKVESAPFVATASDGSKVQMRGGYYPLRYDANRSDVSRKQENAKVYEEMKQGAYGRATTRRGHTKERLKEVKRAVRKDLNVITQHITQVNHDLAWHEWINDTNKLLNDSDISGAITDHYGPNVLDVLRDGVEGIATGDLTSQTHIDQVLLKLRSNVTRATMGASLTTAFLQPFGLTQSMVRIGPKHVLRGMARWGGDAARMESTVGWVRDKSEFMRLRAKTFNKELREIQGAVGGKSKTMKVVDAGLFAMMQKMQMVADIPTWVGQYEKSLGEGLDEEAAIAQADRAVLESQGGGQTKDLSEVQRKHPMLTQFYSYFNVTLNLAAEKTAETDFKNPAAVAGWLGDMALLMVIPAILPSFIMFALKGGDGDDDDMAKRVAQWQLGYLMSTVVGLREFSGAVTGFDYAGPPVGRIAVDFGKATKQIAQGEMDEPAVMSIVNLLGTAFGIPTTQSIRSYKGWKAWDEGQEGAGPQSVLFGPPPRD